MKGFLRKFLVLLGLLGLALAIFIAIRIHDNDKKAALRQAEAEKHQVSQSEAQQLDLGGFSEQEFRVLAEPAAGVAAPSPEQWRALRLALSTGPVPAAILPEQAPLPSPGFGRLRYAVNPEGWRVMVECRSPLPAGTSCEPVALAASRLGVSELEAWRESIKALAPEGVAVYGALHGRRGTEGLDKLIKEGTELMMYNEFCSELGCNGSVSFAVDQVLVKIEGSGNLQPWFAALARGGSEGGKR